MPKFHVIGMGPGSPEYVLPIALAALADAEVLFGAGRLITGWSDFGGNTGNCPKEKVPLEGPVEALLDRLDSLRNSKKCALLVTGDPGFYSLLAAVRRRFSPEDYTVIPGISSFQAACSKLGLVWQEYLLSSAHGRNLDSMLERLSPDRGAIILTDRDSTPYAISRYLKDRGWKNRGGWICENIGKDGERIEPFMLYDIKPEKEYETCLIILQPDCTE